MAEGLTEAGANTALNALAGAYTWIQKHVGAPGAAGTANVASDTSRHQVTWTTSTANSIASNASISDTNVTASEDYTHFSCWSASSGGTCGFTGTITANPVVAGDTITFPSGTFTTSFSTAS